MIDLDLKNLNPYIFGFEGLEALDFMIKISFFGFEAAIIKFLWLTSI